MQTSISILINFIIKQYFSNSGCVLALHDDKHFAYHQSLPWVNIRIINETFDSRMVFGKYYGCQGIVINTANPITVFELMEREIRLNMDRFNNRRYLFIPHSKPIENIFGISQSKSIEFVADLLIILPANDPTLVKDLWLNMPSVNYKLYTHRFTGLNQTNDIILLDEWYSATRTFKRGVNLYTDKLRNGDGRIFKVATITYKPYSIPDALEGIELKLYITFCEKINLTPSLYVDEEGEFGEIYDNWTGYGILGNVLNDYGDVGFGGVPSWAHEYDYLDLSKPVIRSGITTIAPAPIRISDWLLPTLSFSSELWIAVLVVFLVCSLFLFIFDELRYNVDLNRRHPTKLAPKNEFYVLQNSCFHTASIFLMQPLGKNELKCKKKKYIYGALFLLSILITTSYSSGLASSMAVSRYTNAIKTTQDLVDSEILWGATSIAWITSIVHAPELKYVLLSQRFLIADESALKVYNGEKFAFAVERLPAGYFAIGDYVTEEGVSQLRLMDEDIYYAYTVFMAKKSSIWLRQLDNFILLISQSGLQRFWEMNATISHMDAKIQTAVKYSMRIDKVDGQPRKLNVKHVKGSFGLLLVGYVFAFICFLVEISVAMLLR